MAAPATERARDLQKGVKLGHQIYFASGLIIEPLPELWKSRRFSTPCHLSAAKGHDALRRFLRDGQADPDLGADTDGRLHIDRSTVEVNRARCE